ncbi:MAG: cell division FtsA domain-containing protein [Patescibacteria group bacterium]
MSFLPKIISKKNKGKYVLSLDVGTKMAKALVSYVDYEEDTVTNLGVGRAEQETGNVVGGKITDVKKVTEALRLAVADAEQMANISPKEAVIGFSGNTIKIHTNSFKTVREDPQSKIDVAELKNMVRAAHQKSLEDITRGLTYREQKSGIKLASADIINFSIDGYRIINPLNFKGGNIEIGISSSYVSFSDFEIINDIADGLGVRLLKVAYGPYAVIKAIGAEDSLSFSAIMIDVGGNITDVAVIKNGNIQSAGMFVLGGRLFTRRLANKLNISEQIAEELKIKYAADRFVADEKTKIEKMLAEDVDLWLSGVELILGDAGAKSLLPCKIFLYGGGSRLPGLANSLNHLDNSDIAFSDKVKLDFIRLDHIAGNTDKTRKLDDFQDITLVGLAHLCLEGTDDKEDIANNFLAEIV